MTNLNTLLLNNLPTSVITGVVNRLSASIVRAELLEPRDAMGLAHAFVANMGLLETDSNAFVMAMDDAIAGTYTALTKGERAYEVDYKESEFIAVGDYLAVLRGVDYIHADYIEIGKGLYNAVVTQSRSSKLRLAVEGVINRKRDYVANGSASDRAKDSIHALERTESQLSTKMLDISRAVYRAGTPVQRGIMDNEMYVLQACAKMKPNTAYVSEFFFDKRFRMYQSDCQGYNGQTGDMSRSLMDLHGVEDYNPRVALALLLEEANDMGKFVDENQLWAMINIAAANPVEFILDHLEKDKGITKPWNFAKVSDLITQIKAGKKPYIGMAVGYDAKCSGPQLAGLLISDDGILVSCGFTTKQVDDAYENCIKKCKQQKFTGITRPMIKKAFMAVFYGAGKGAMLCEETITTELFEHIYPAGTEYEMMEQIAERLFKAINLSFGERLNRFRKLVKEAGVEYFESMAIPKYDKPVEYTMPDSSVVKMDYRVQVTAEGCPVQYDEVSPNMLVVCKGEQHRHDKVVFNTKHHDYTAYSRRGFVNLVQAIDAQLARLIVINCEKFGAKHVVSIHDCFRVNINDTGILQRAIKESYVQLFGSVTNDATYMLPEGTDILRAYFKGSREATRPEYKAQAVTYSQFYTAGRRVLSKIDGVKFTTLIHKLGDTKYFAK